MKTAFLVSLVLLSTTSMNERGVSGQWVVSQDRDFRGNRGKPTECTFQQQHDALAVRCTAAGAMTGEVHGTQVTWGADRTDIPPIVKDHLFLKYSGELNGSRDTIKGKWSLKSQVSGIDERGTFEAKRKS